MFEFICKDYHDSFYYLSSLLLLPMLRLSHLWPLGVLFVQAALVPFHEKWSVESLLRVLTVISTVSFQWTELGTGQNWETGSTCLSMYLSTYLASYLLVMKYIMNLNLCFLLRFWIICFLLSSSNTCISFFPQPESLFSKTT